MSQKKKRLNLNPIPKPKAKKTKFDLIDSDKDNEGSQDFFLILTPLLLDRINRVKPQRHLVMKEDAKPQYFLMSKILNLIIWKQGFLLLH